MNSVLLFSGGLDSTTVLYMLRSMRKEPRLLYITGWENEGELAAIRKYDNVQMIYAGLPLPAEHTAFIPARNAVFLSLAASWAVAHEIEEHSPVTIYTGLYYDPMSFDYLDTHPDFLDLIASSLKFLHPELDFRHPLQGMSKMEVYDMAVSLGVPIEETWSCYARDTLTPCGVCGACIKRNKAKEDYYVRRRS